MKTAALATAAARCDALADAVLDARTRRDAAVRAFNEAKAILDSRESELAAARAARDAADDAYDDLNAATNA